MSIIEALQVCYLERSLEAKGDPYFNPVRLFAAETYLRLCRAPVSHAAMSAKED